MKLAVLGATLLPDDLFNIGKENVARGVNTPKKIQNDTTRFIREILARTCFFSWNQVAIFILFLKKNVNLQLLDLEHALPNKKFNIITDGSYSTSENLSTV